MPAVNKSAAGSSFSLSGTISFFLYSRGSGLDLLLSALPDRVVDRSFVDYPIIILIFKLGHPCLFLWFFLKRHIEVASSKVEIDFFGQFVYSGAYFRVGFGWPLFEVGVRVDLFNKGFIL